MSEFAEHEIVSEVRADGFASWLLQRRRDGRLSSTFWVRITAAERMLRVSGDFEPVVFAYGPDDPEACVRWMASRNGPDSYAMEKAAIGTGGRNRVSAWDPNLARADLREARDEEAKENPDSGFVRAVNDALERGHDYGGEYGCHEYVRMVLESERLEHTDILELIASAGRRPHPCVGLALRACQRLTDLLQAAEDAERNEP